jgi:hypothetical protein
MGMNKKCPGGEDRQTNKQQRMAGTEGQREGMTDDRQRDRQADRQTDLSDAQLLQSTQLHFREELLTV